MPLAQAIPGGVSPIQPNDVGDSGLRQRIIELRDLDPEQVKALSAPLYATLSPTVQSGFDTFRAPTTHDFVVHKILPYLVFMDIANASEIATDGNAAVALPSFADRLVARANNILIDLQNQDRQSKFIDNHSLSLGSLMPPLGDPLKYENDLLRPKILAGESVRLDVRFASVATPSQLGAATQYGIVLVGLLIRVAKS